MNWDYKLTKKQIEALNILMNNGGELQQAIADTKIHWRTQHNLYVKLLTDSIATGNGVVFRITERGINALNDL